MVKYKWLGTFKVESVSEDGTVIFDRATPARKGDLVCGDGTSIRCGMTVDILRPYA